MFRCREEQAYTLHKLHCTPGAILSTRSMTPWPTVPLPPMLARPAALMTSCSLSATLICTRTRRLPHHLKDHSFSGRNAGAPSIGCTGDVHSDSLNSAQNVEFVFVCCVLTMLTMTMGWPQ